VKRYTQDLWNTAQQPYAPTQARTTGLILLALAARCSGRMVLSLDGASGREPDAFSRGNRDYYNLLARGFLKGTSPWMCRRIPIWPR